MNGLWVAVNGTILIWAFNLYCCSAMLTDDYPKLKAIVKAALKKCSGGEDVLILNKRQYEAKQEEFEIYRCLMRERVGIANEEREAFKDAMVLDMGARPYANVTGTCLHYEVLFGVTSSNTNMAGPAFWCYRREYRDQKNGRHSGNSFRPREHHKGIAKG